MDWIYLYILIYILILLGVSYFISKRQGKEGFLIGNRDRGGWQIAFSKFAGAIGAGVFITYTGFVYEYGFGVFAILLGLITGYFLFAYWAAPKIQRDSKRRKFYTIGDFVYSKTKNIFSKKLSNWTSNLILFLWLLVGIIGGAKIITDFGFLSYEVAVILTTLVILIYIILAGYKAVLLTDVIQSIVILLLLVLVTFSIVGSFNIGSLFLVETTNLDIGTAIGFFLFGVLAIFSYSNMYQLCYAAKNKNHLKHGIGLAIIPVIFSGFLLLLVGLFMASNVLGLDSGLVFTEALRTFLSPKLLPFAIVLFFAGIMSSADTNIYAIASHHSIEKKGSKIKNIRISSGILIILTLLISLIFRDIVDVSIIAGSISMILSLPIIYLLLGGRSPKKFIASTLAGFVGLLLGLFILGIEPTAMILALIFSALGLLWKK
jgi:Na+/proline symporter